MSTQTDVETVTTGADKAKLAGSAVLVVAAIAAYYLLAKQDLWLRVAVLLGVLALGIVLFFLSETGKQLIGFSRDAKNEVKKVVWPSRNEAMQMTLYVFGFVFVMALMMWITDKTIEWVLYDLILGWRK